MDYKKYPKSLRIGFVGDQNARTPTVDISELLPELPGATATLLFRRPGEETAYPAAAQLDENGILTWTVSGGDARYPGTGCAQVLLSKGTGVNEQRLLGPVIMVTVLNSIAGLTSEDAPEGFESWIAEIEAAGEEAAKDAEAWAKGTRGGTAVESTDPAWHANAAYHAGQAGDSASDAEAFAKGTRGGTAVESTDPAYHANAAYHAGQAGDSASDAEAFAKGTRGGADVGSSDPAYHNNAKYYAEQAADSAEEAGRSYAPAIRTTASGSVAHFTDAVAAPMALDIVINPKISGYTNVTVTRAGRNLLKDTGAEFPNTNKGVTATKNSDGSITITGSGTGSSDSIIAIGLTADLKLITGKRYILSGCPSGGSSDTYRLRIAAPTWAIDTGSGVTFTPTGTYGSTEVQITVKKGYTLPTGGVTFKPMIRPASDTDATFKPYNGTDYEITLPDDAGTVYGGNLHINQDGSAALTVTHGYIASYAGETLPGTWISDQDVYASGTTPTTGAQVVYALASSTTYPFTATQISSLLGENNVWADTGDVTAEYTADTKTYIERLTQPDADWIADAGISIGKFFMVGNELYIATSGIAAGETITPGTNCTKMSLAQALNNINA